MRHALSDAEWGRSSPSCKQCRRVATRYEKLAENFLAFVKLAAIRVWPRVNESTPP
jgi:transposase